VDTDKLLADLKQRPVKELVDRHRDAMTDDAYLRFILEYVR
jgi:hypothetical protein